MEMVPVLETVDALDAPTEPVKEWELAVGEDEGERWTVVFVAVSLPVL